MSTDRPHTRSLPTAVTGRAGLLVAGPFAVYLASFHGATAAAGAAVLCFGLVVWPRPDLALLMLLGLVPVAAVADPSGTTTYMTVMAAAGLLLFRILLTGPRLRPELVLVLIMALVVAVSCLLPQEAFPVVAPWHACALLLLGLALLVASALAPPDPRRVAQIVAGSGAGIAGYLLLDGEYASHRLTGLGLNPNYLGAALALPLVTAVGLVRFHRCRPWLVPAAVCALAVLETRSRGAFVMVAVGLACVLLAGRPLWQKTVTALTIGVVVLALPGALDSLQGDLTGGRTPTELNANTHVREQAALLALRVALDHPLRGIGYGMFPEYARSSSVLGIYINTHNDYLRLAAETGLVTLAALLALLWLGLSRRYPADHAVLQSLCVSYAVGLLFANALTDFLVSTPFWISLGCLLAHTASRKAVPSPLPLPPPT
ncbi:O-antigen ligase family protein [Streptomyces sp. NPDC003753]